MVHINAYNRLISLHKTIKLQFNKAKGFLELLFTFLNRNKLANCVTAKPF